MSFAQLRECQESRFRLARCSAIRSALKGYIPKRLSIQKKKDEKMQIEDRKQQINNEILGPYHANDGRFYCNPHHNKQLQEIKVIYSGEVYKQIQQEETCQYFQFLNICRNNLFNVIAKLQSAGRIELIKDNEQPVDALLGKNIIKVNQQIKHNKIELPFNSIPANENKILLTGNFESGNLSQYFSIIPNQYMIVLKNDTNTHGYNQWFHFYAYQPNIQENCVVNFVIVNISKSIFFMPGMKLLSRNNKENQSKCHEWKRNISFQLFQSNLQRPDRQKYYNIAFCIKAEQLRQGIFIALTIPYTYSRLHSLQQQLMQVSSDFQTIQVGKSLLGNSIMVFRLLKSCRKLKKNIIILARQHSSQSSSSFISEIIIKRLAFLNCHDQLIQEFNWHVIPVMNPDGVIHGNSRVNAKGYDINRCWAYMLLQRSPEAQCVFSYLEQLKVSSQDIFIDLHSHSRDLGCFSFFNAQNQFSLLFNSKMSEFCRFYNLDKCRTGADVTKKNTFRVQMAMKLKIKNIVTFETSYYGYICNQTNELKSFKISDYQQMALSILKTLQSYINKQKILTIQSTIDQKLAPPHSNSREPSQQIKQLSDSDTDPQGDYLNEQQRDQIQQPNIKKQLSNPSIQYSQNNKINITDIITNKYKKKQDKKKDNKSNNQATVLNIYQRSLKVTNQYDYSKKQYKKLRPYTSKFSVEDQHHCEQTSRLLFNKIKQTLSHNQCHYLPNYYYKIPQMKSYSQRKSLKKLFASTQLRNNQSCEKKQQKQESSKNKITFLKQKQRKQIKTVKNIYFPLSTNLYQQYEKQMKLLLCNTTRKKTRNRILSCQGQLKKQQNNVGYKINQKIAQLCEFAKNIQKLTTYS